MTDSIDLWQYIENPSLLSSLELEKLLTILNTAKNLFENEKLFLEFDSDDFSNEFYIIGDIHGNFDTLIKLFNIIQVKRPYRVIFLGDIVDRGPKQVECLMFILILKILCPKLYYILRGNHETLEMNQYYGFLQEITTKYEINLEFKTILSVYGVLPICAAVNKTVLCLHGGIPQDIHILKKIKNIKTKDIAVLNKSSLSELYQIMWNDPKENIKGFSNSYRGSGIKFFGQDVFDKFLQENNFSYLIRAHECFSEGYRWFFQNRLLSIFSSANYRGSYTPNPASYAIIKNRKVIPKLLR
jgi:diadenosine tetraphosphatase ApaH/serine/threonine PP2A family protein phosphatase